MNASKVPRHSDESSELDASGSYDTYVEYNKILRTWFVAFGVGGPALLLTHERLINQLTSASNLKWVLGLFFAGVGLQVLGAFLNKMANWYVHRAYTSAEELSGQWKYKFAECLAEQFWIDIVIDIGTIAAFGSAAFLMWAAFVG